MGSASALPESSLEAKSRALFAVMASGVVVEMLLGVGELFVVPFGRNSSWNPRSGRLIYLPHALIGLLLAAGAIATIAITADAARQVRLAARLGAIGLFVAGVGGLAAVFHGSRLVGMAVMFVGSIVACMAYLMPYLTHATRADEVGALEAE